MAKDFSGFDKQIKLEMYFQAEEIDVTEEEKDYTSLLLLLVRELKKRNTMAHARRILRRYKIKDTLGPKLYKRFLKQASIISRVYKGKVFKFTYKEFQKLESFEGETFKQRMLNREIGIKRSALKFAKEIQTLVDQNQDTTDALMRYRQIKEKFDIGLVDTHAKQIRNYVYEHFEKGLKKKGWVRIALLQPGTCAICAGLHGTFYSIKNYSSRTQIPQEPPTHFRCGCNLIVVEEQYTPEDYYEQSLDTFFERNKDAARDILGKKKYRLWEESGKSARTLYDKNNNKWFTNEQIEKRLKIG